MNTNLNFNDVTLVQDLQNEYFYQTFGEDFTLDNDLSADKLLELLFTAINTLSLESCINFQNCDNAPHIWLNDILSEIARRLDAKMPTESRCTCLNDLNSDELINIEQDELFNVQEIQELYNCDFTELSYVGLFGCLNDVINVLALREPYETYDEYSPALTMIDDITDRLYYVLRVNERGYDDGEFKIHSTVEFY